MSSRLAEDYLIVDTGGFPAFNGYPYLVTLLIPSFHHVILLPKGLDLKALFELSVNQATKNKLECCLVIDEKTCVYFDEKGEATLSSIIPKGAFISSDQLKLSQDLPESEELDERRKAFLKYKYSINHRVSGYLIGDPKKGGHPACAEELLRLKGRQADGIPKGLEQCSACNEWKGFCLDISPEFEPLIVEVECSCANKNLCALCGKTLYVHKLNANYLRDGEVWHVPGFIALDHRCEE